MSARYSLAFLLLLLAACGAEKRRPEGGGAVPPVDHERFFPIAAGFHGGLACQGCHPDGNHLEQFSCVGCHKHEEGATSFEHSVLPACGAGDDPLTASCFRYESSACLSCHPRGEVGASVRPASHEAVFPIAAGTAHGDVACTSCHADPQQRTDVTCSSGTCHPAAEVGPTHAQVGGFAVDSKLCERCHADAQVDRVESHLPLSIAVGAPHEKAACLTCHPQVRDDKPFGADFAVKTCVDGGCHPQAATDVQHGGIDGYGYDTGSCLTCHPDGTRGTATVDHPRFPIAAGTAHRQATCGSCHLDPADRTSITCSNGGCHAAAEVTPQHALVSDFSLDAKRCERCHADGQVDRVDAHPFALAAPAPHHSTDTRSGACLTCHPQVRADKAFGADFKKASCLSCHESDRAFHVGIPGATFDDASCLGCHPGGGKDVSFPHPSFPVGAGSAHDEAGCADCHVNAADRTDVTCSSGTCHPAAQVTPQHAHVGGFAVDSRLCERCHADGQVDRMADHAPLGITAGAPHFESSCLACHPGFRADKAFGADFTRKDCLPCHEHEKGQMDLLHGGIELYAYDTTSCLTCHPDGLRDSSFVHALFPIAVGSKHEKAACLECHADPADHADVTCSSGTCHASADVTPQHANVGGFAVDSKLCESCHAESQVFRLSQHTPFAIGSGSAHFEEKCLTCHPTMRKDDHPWGTDFAVKTCVDGSCHPQVKTGTDHAGVAGYEYVTASCLDCHPSGSAADAVDHTDKYPIGPGTSHAGVACSECHTDASDRKVVTCAGSCHGQTDMSTAHTGKVGGYSYKNALCLKCHPDTPAFRVANHKPFVITASGRHSACLTCHPSLRADRPFDAANFKTYDCLGSGCHSNALDLASHHQGRAGYAYVSTTCTKAGCHPTGKGN